jgi:hypothetical protein
MASSRLLLLAALLLSGCQPDAEATLRSVDAQRAPGEILLDLREDGTRLFAAVLPVPPASDAPRAVIARWLDQGGTKASPWAFDGIPVFDARLVPGSQAALVITTGRDLVLLPARRGLPARLDSQVHPPLSLSQDGRYLAYARGEIPDLEIARYDLAHRTPAGGTQSMAPAWSPVLSEDGSRLLFVSGSTGYPEIWELHDDLTVVQRTDRRREPVPFPAGPSAPLWNDGTIAFEDPDGVHVMSVDPPRLQRSLPGALPVLVSRSRAFIVQDPGGQSPRWVAFDGAEVAR